MVNPKKKKDPEIPVAPIFTARKADPAVNDDAGRSDLGPQDDTGPPLPQPPSQNLADTLESDSQLPVTKTDITELGGEKPVIHNVWIRSASSQRCLTLETTTRYKVVAADLTAGDDTASCEIHLFENLNKSPISLIFKNDTKKYQLLYTEDYKILLKDNNLPSTNKLFIVQHVNTKFVSFCTEDNSRCLCIKKGRVIFDKPNNTTEYLFQMIPTS